MLLDLLQGAPQTTKTHTSNAFTSLQEELSFTEILSSCFPEAASSMSVLHILQEGAYIPACADAFFRAHSETQTALPALNYGSPLHSIISQNQDGKKQHLTSMHHTEVAFPRTYNSEINSEIAVAPWLQSPCKRSHEGPQASAGSSATSEPSSTLENAEIAAQNRQVCHQYPSSQWLTTPGGGFRSEDGAQHSCQTSLDEGSSIQISMQESMPSAHHVHIPDTAPSTAAMCAHLQIKDTCCPDSHPQRDVHKRDRHGAIESHPTKKRKRTRICKNSKEVESQRMTHITVERNRRKQMNEHLSVLRSLMPATYIQRGDQASIIGGAINFVKELEQVVQALQIKKRLRNCEDIISIHDHDSGLMLENPMLKQESTHYRRWSTKSSYIDTPKDIFAHSTCGGVDVKVKLIGSSALVKVLAKKIPHQLLKASLSLESLHFRIIHLNITTIDQSVFYSFNLEMQDEFQVLTASDMAQSILSMFKLDR